MQHILQGCNVAVWQNGNIAQMKKQYAVLKIYQISGPGD